MDHLIQFCETPGSHLMKKHLFFLVIVCLCISTYSFDLIESYKLDRDVLSDEVILGDYDIKIHGNRYSINEWWEDQPRIRLDYQGEEAYIQEIHKALQSLGFVFGSGELFQVKTETIND